jgi:hypothetical protein
MSFETYHQATGQLDRRSRTVVAVCLPIEERQNYNQHIRKYNALSEGCVYRFLDTNTTRDHKIITVPKGLSFKLGQKSYDHIFLFNRRKAESGNLALLNSTP